MRRDTQEAAGRFRDVWREGTILLPIILFSVRKEMF